MPPLRANIIAMNKHATEDGRRCAKELLDLVVTDGIGTDCKYDISRLKLRQLHL